MFIPDRTSEEALELATVSVATDIFDLQNENRHPDCGTLGFAMGTALALGNIASAYVQDGTPKQRKDFLKIVLAMVRDGFENPSAVAELEGVDAGRFN